MRQPIRSILDRSYPNRVIGRGTVSEESVGFPFTFLSEDQSVVTLTPKKCIH
jgi:hypothetical protein